MNVWRLIVAVLAGVLGWASDACTEDDLLAGWRGTAGVRVGLIWSDNLTLTRTGGESGGVIRVLPYISTARDGNRLRLSFNYGPSILYYPTLSDRTRVNHVLGANASAELVERYLFLDVRARANQALINPSARAGFDSIANNGAYTQTASITVTPRLVVPVLGGRFATIEVQPGAGNVWTASTAGDNGRSSTPTTNTRISVVSGPMFTRVPWSLNWRRRQWDADTGDGTGVFTASVGYILSSRYRVTGIVGYEDSSYTARNNRSRGTRWEFRFDWTPKPTTAVKLGYGQTFYGDFGDVAISHRHKYWAFSTTYRVSIETAFTSIEEQEVVPLEDAFGNPILDPINGDVIRASVTTPVLIEESFLRRRWRTTLAYSRGRTNVTGQWIVTDREYSQSDRDTSDNQWRLNLRRSLSGRLSANAQFIYWDHSQSQSANSLNTDYIQHAVTVGLSYRLGQRTTLRARVAHEARNAEDRFGDFSENRASLDLSFRL